MCQMLVSPIHAEQIILAMLMKAAAALQSCGRCIGGLPEPVGTMCKPAKGSRSAQMAGWPNTA